MVSACFSSFQVVSARFRWFQLVLTYINYGCVSYIGTVNFSPEEIIKQKLHRPMSTLKLQMVDVLNCSFCFVCYISQLTRQIAVRFSIPHPKYDVALGLVCRDMISF